MFQKTRDGFGLEGVFSRKYLKDFTEKTLVGFVNHFYVFEASEMGL